MKKYDAKYFISKFEKIPEDKWCTRAFHRDGKSCAFGHCGGALYQYNEEVESLVNLFCHFRNDYGLGVTTTNDGERVKEYSALDLGDTPKERIINALCMIDAGMLEDV